MCLGKMHSSISVTVPLRGRIPRGKCFMDSVQDSIQKKIIKCQSFLSTGVSFLFLSAFNLAVLILDPDSTGTLWLRQQMKTFPHPPSAPLSGSAPTGVARDKSFPSPCSRGCTASGWGFQVLLKCPWLGRFLVIPFFTRPCGLMTKCSCIYGQLVSKTIVQDNV